MNVIKAREVAQYVAELKGISASFAAAYGSDHHLTEDSPRYATDLYRRSMSLQATIASNLNPQAIAGAYTRYGAWWERADMIPSSIVNEMATAVFELIGRCAYNEDPQTGATNPSATLVLEQSIAGMLHPSTLVMELRHIEDTPETVEVKQEQVR